MLGMLGELTEVHASPTAYKIVQLSSPEIFNYPFIYFSEPGFMVLNDQEVKNLGEYIRRGGFILPTTFVRRTIFTARKSSKSCGCI